MLTLFHSPRSRSTRIISLLHELGAFNQVDVQIVTIPRVDGSGGPDPKNPHPEHKVPLLVHDGVEIWESPAIILYLTDLFPDVGLGPMVGDRLRGAYLSWLAWYGDVVEPVMVMQAAGLSHPILQATFRGMPELVARLEKALSNAPYLLGDAFSAADLLLYSPFAWFPEVTPDVPAIKAWIDRCGQRASMKEATTFDTMILAA